MSPAFSGLGPTVGTYAERVALVSPQIGQLFYQTDTDEYLKYVSYGGSNRWMQADLKPNRNVIINGSNAVAQRSTSVPSITASGYFTADRCFAQVITAGTHTQSVIADAPPVGLSRSIRMLCTTAAASLAAGAQLHLDCRIEGQDVQRFAKGTTGAKRFTVSFWVKSNKTGTYVLTLEDNTNSRMTGQAYSVTASGVWEYKTITYTSETSNPIADNNSTGMSLLFWLAAGSSLQSGALQNWGPMTTANYAVGNVNLADTVGNYFQITGIQLEVGSAPSEFEFEPFETTLRKCQRYFEKSYDVDVTPGTNTGAGQPTYWGGTQNDGFVGGHVKFVVTKRVTPSTIQAYTEAGVLGSWTILRAGASSNAAANVLWQGQSGMNIYVNTGVANTVARVNGHWTASSEL